MDLNKRLFDLLFESRRTQKELADFLGVNERNVSAWKARGSNPPSELIAPIASFFGMSADKFLTGSDAVPTNVVGGDVNGGTVVQGAGRDVILGSGSVGLSAECSILVDLFNSFDIKRRVSLLGYAFSLDDEMKKERQNSGAGGSSCPDPVVRSVRVDGTCAEWFPRVKGAMESLGCDKVSADFASFSLSGQSHDGMRISASLAPVGDKVEVVFSVTTNVDLVDKIVDKVVAL